MLRKRYTGSGEGGVEGESTFTKEKEEKKPELGRLRSSWRGRGAPLSRVSWRGKHRGRRRNSFLERTPS